MPTWLEVQRRKAVFFLTLHVRIIDSMNIELGPNWQPSTTKMAVPRLSCNAERSEVFLITEFYHLRSEKLHLFSVVPPTKPAQAISSIVSPKIKVEPNWQPSTTKMAMAQLRCHAES